MEDIGITFNRNGIISQNEADHVLTKSHRVTLRTCCTKSLKCIKDWHPVDYKYEIIQVFKLTGPVVSFGFDTVENYALYFLCSLLRYGPEK